MATKSIYKAGIGQMRSTNNKDANLKLVQQLVGQAKESNVQLLFLPECCDFVGENREETLCLSEPFTGGTIRAYADLAKQNNMWLSFGGIHESILDSNGEKTDKIFNSHVIIDSNGDIVKIYRKLHLFDVVTPDYRFSESNVVSPGDRIIPPIDTPIGKLGMQICYDMRFPEVSTKLRQLGADIIAYPSAFSFFTGKAHWEILLRARAIENQVYVVAPAQVGFHNAKRRSFGNGMIVDPYGGIIASCGDSELSVAAAEIDLDKIASIRQNMPCFEHRRNDVYNLTAIETCDLGNIDRAFGPYTIPKSTIFFESPHCFAFTNLRCVVKGHVLVSTKRVVPRLMNITREEMADMFTSVNKVQRMLEKIYGTSAATVTVQDGPDAGQTVEHVHFHVMPRRKGDFGENDEIYVQLEKIGENKEREVSAMAAEAQMYREFLANN